MKASLQRIEDVYVQKGYTGEKLLKALNKDKNYLTLLNKRKSKLTKKVALNNIEEQKYVMSTDKDYLILEKVKKLEKKKLTKEEKFLIKLIKSQLEHDWRKFLIKELNQLLKKYDK